MDAIWYIDIDSIGISVVVGMMNLVSRISSNGLLASNENSLLRDSEGSFCHFISCSSNETTYTLVKYCLS